MRVGYAISHPDNIKMLSKRHNGFGMGMCYSSVAGATAALRDTEFLKFGIKRNARAKEMVSLAFDSWGVKYNKSSTNFIYARAEHFVPDVVDKLKEHGIRITKWPSMTRSHIRISMGKTSDMEKFVDAVQKYLA